MLQHILYEISILLFFPSRSEVRRPEEEEEEEEEEILGSDDDEQEDPKDYIKGENLIQISCRLYI